MRTFLTAVGVVVLVAASLHAGYPWQRWDHEWTAMSAIADAREQEGSPSFNSAVVVRGAVVTWQNYLGWWHETRGTPLCGDIELDTSLWAEGIARLKPEYVYTHGVNIVIVRSRLGEDEEGFYVALSIASSPGPDDEQFTRMLIAQGAGGTVSTFRRRGHFERTQLPWGQDCSSGPPAGADPTQGEPAPP
jgi:hypothetical protein